MWGGVVLVVTLEDVGFSVSDSAVLQQTYYLPDKTFRPEGPPHSLSGDKKQTLVSSKTIRPLVGIQAHEDGTTKPQCTFSIRVLHIYSRSYTVGSLAERR